MANLSYRNNYSYGPLDRMTVRPYSVQTRTYVLGKMEMHALIALGIIIALVGFVCGETAARAVAGLILAMGALAVLGIIFIVVCNGCMADVDDKPCHKIANTIAIAGNCR